MRITRRHLFLALALFVLGVLYDVWAFRQLRDSGGADEAPLLSTIPVVPAPEPAGQRVDPRAIPPPPPVDLSTPPVWTRDPFAPGREPPRQARAARPATAPRPVEPPLPLVSSILYSSDRKLAIVNGRIVRVGDRVAGGEVVDILRDAVVLKTGSGAVQRVPLSAGARRQ